ncbi:unnamed protein product, partial [marine sediment metagenome]
GLRIGVPRRIGARRVDQARRLVAEKGARLNGEPIIDPVEPIAVSAGDILQCGKRKFARLALALRNTWNGG